MQSATDVAVATQLDRDALIEREPHEVKRLVHDRRRLRRKGQGWARANRTMHTHDVAACWAGRARTIAGEGERGTTRVGRPRERNAFAVSSRVCVAEMQIFQGFRRVFSILITSKTTTDVLNSLLPQPSTVRPQSLALSGCISDYCRGVVKLPSTVALRFFVATVVAAARVSVASAGRAVQ